MKDIKKVEIEGEKIYMKKSSLGWRVIQPWKNEDGSINWFNFLTGGSWSNLLFISIVILVILGVLYEYANNINVLLSCFDNINTLEICKQSFMPEYQKIIIP